MSIAKVIERKERKSSVKKNRWEMREILVKEFISFVEETQASKLSEIFPSVVISDGTGSNVVGVTYSPSRVAGFKNHIIGSSTHNIVLSSTKDQFNIGYGSNTARGSKEIPFDLNTLTKAKKKKLFKQIIECLVSEAYWVGYKQDKEHQVWKGRERVVLN